MLKHCWPAPLDFLFEDEGIEALKSSLTSPRSHNNQVSLNGGLRLESKVGSYFVVPTPKEKPRPEG